jgi:excisionase family DNA binding protein
LQGKLLLRVSEAAALLSISRSSCYELIHSGEIPSIKLGQSLRAVSEDLQRWIDEKKRERF